MFSKILLQWMRSLLIVQNQTHYSIISDLGDNEMTYVTKNDVIYQAQLSLAQGEKHGAFSENELTTHL